MDLSTVMNWPDGLCFFITAACSRHRTFSRCCQTFGHTFQTRPNWRERWCGYIFISTEQDRGECRHAPPAGLGERQRRCQQLHVVSAIQQTESAWFSWCWSSCQHHCRQRVGRVWRESTLIPAPLVCCLHDIPGMGIAAEVSWMQLHLPPRECTHVWGVLFTMNQ